GQSGASKPLGTKNPPKKRKYVKGRVSMPKKRHVMQFLEVADASTTSTSQLHSASVPTFHDESTDHSKEQRVMETDIYQEIVSEMPVDISTLLDTSFIKEVADEEDLAFDDVPKASHNLETISEDPMEGVLEDPTNHNKAKESIEEVQMTVAGYIAFSLQALLPSLWVTDCSSDHTVRLSYLTPYENVSVQKCIVWNGKDIKIYVHNRPLPSESFMWHSAKCEDTDNYGEVIDVLFRLANLLQCAKVCEGIKLYNSQWKKLEEQGKGTTEKGIYEDYKCFRHTSCSLLTTEHTRCSPCHNLQRNMKDQVRRSNQSTTTDQTRKNDRYRSAEEKNKKLEELEKEKKILKMKLNRIRKRAKEEIENNGINIDTDSSHDLARIFQQEYNNMTPVQRIFWSEQMKALSCQKKPSSIRWNPFLIKMAIHLRMKTTSQGYKYIQNFIKLPSERTLYDYTHAVQSKEGIQDAAVADLVHKSSSYKEEHLKYFNLEFDEMHIRQDIVINKKTGEIIGYANLRQVEKDLADIEAEISKTDSAHPVAKTVLVYLAQGVTNPLLSAVGIYPSRDLSAGQLFSRTWDIVYTLESCGLKVLCLICDGASINKKFFSMHPAIDPLSVKSQFTYATKNLAAAEDRPLFFMVDPPHLLKTIRNCLANSYSHKKSRKMWKNGEDLSWVTIEKLYAASPHKFASHNLTRAHIKLTPFSCMKVILATQTMSNSVSRDLQEKRDHPTLTNCDTTELIKFIKIVNDGFDCLNGSGDIQGKRNKYNNLLLPYTDVNDERFKWLQEEYLGFFQDWKKSIEQRKGKFSADAREKMCVSHQAYESMHITSYGFIGAVTFMLREAHAPSVDAKRFNQDKLEQYFGNMRMSGGGSRNPNSQEFRNRANLVRIADNAARPITTGNTTVEQEEWIPDQTPLQKFFRTRKQ
ncbi:Transposable element P transposase, partial [Frankliniella fusca]